MASQPLSRPPRESERTARFLHDVIAPSLSVVGFQLDLLRAELPEHRSAAARLAEVQSIVEALMEHVREYSSQIRSGERLPAETGCPTT